MQKHEPRLQLARQHIDSGRLDLAKAVLQRAIQSDPRDAAANNLMSYVLAHTGEPRQGMYYARRAAELAPTNVDYLANLGNQHALVNERDQAAAAYRKALEVDPRHMKARAALTGLLNNAARFDEAEEACLRGLDYFPGDTNFLGDLAVAKLMTGRAREAVAILRQAAAAHPEDSVLASGLPYSMNYAGDLDPRDVFEAHASYGRLVKRSAPGEYRAPEVDRDPERKLRVGIVSGDLRTHACGFFAEPLLRGHDRQRFEIVCYSTTVHEDAMSQRLRGYVSGWRQGGNLSPATLAAAVRADKIDVLVEMSGHTAGHRLPMLHLRPAPVQVTYFGYPNTTGVEACDYRIVDSFTDPREPWYDSLATERLWRLDPCFLCYSPLQGAPDASPAPSTRGEPFTFGSFNAIAKLDDLTIGLMAGALKAAPGSRLFMKYHGLGAPSVKSAIERRFAAAGIGSERLLLEGPAPNAAAMLPAYARMDVMLDSFPYHGTTTTCEALYMGVPVVTLAGRTCCSRVGKSILTNAGLPELVADDEAGYVRTAAELARNPERLAAVRAGLRERVLASPVCDAAAFVERFQGALREMWREYCRARA